MQTNAIQLAILLPAMYGAGFLVTARLEQLELIRSLPLLFSDKLKNVPFIILALVFVFTYIFSSVGCLIGAAAGLPNGLDNKAPRLERNNLRGWSHRAVAAHQNLLEGFPGFAAAIIAVHVQKASIAHTATLACLHLLARCVFYPAYLFNIDQVRSGAYVVAISSTAFIFGFACIPNFESYYQILINITHPWY
ncbi:hypothetical protein BDF19DRAFT_445191 [Syncephalis fuscata]|nr:hypothetical protein BDF19DRAFT_445191 [Syncephalis fuscata]